MRQKETETEKIENKKHVIKHDTDTFDKTPNILRSSANTIQFKRFLIQIRRYKKFNLINLVVCLACVYPINVLSMYNILEMRKNDRFDHCALFHLLLKANNKASLRVYVYFFSIPLLSRLKIDSFVCNHTHFTKQTNNIYNSGRI